MHQRRLIARVMSLAFLFGLLFWVVDAVIHKFYFAERLRLMMFEPPETLFDALLLKLTPHTLFVRLSFLVASLLGGLAVALYLRGQRINEARYRSYIRGAPIAIFVTNRGGDYIRVNPAACDMTGYSEAELLRMKVGDLHDVRAVGSERVRFQQAIRDTGVSAEIVMRRKDGVSIDVQLDAVMLPGGELLAFCRDITELKHVAQEREHLLEIEREQRLQAEILAEVSMALASQTSQSAVLREILNQAQRIVPFQTAHIALLEGDTLRTASWLGYDAWDSEDMFSRLAWPLEDFPFDAEVLHMQHPVVILDTHQDARWVVMEGTAWVRSHIAIPICSSDRAVGLLRLDGASPGQFGAQDAKRLQPLANIAGVVLENVRLHEDAQRELSERKRIESELRQHREHLEEEVRARTSELNARVTEVERLNRALTNILEDLQATNRNLEAATMRLQEANQELDDFAYVISHDLKAPLRGINQLATWIVEDYAAVLDDEGKHKLTLLTDRVTRMHALINGVLQYSRAGRSSEQVRPVDLNQLVQDVITLLAPPAHIHVNVENTLPVVIGEPTRLAQIFQNLLDNGIKFMDKSEGWLKIGCVDSGTHWQFSVSDNGPGIAQRHYDKIFQLFQTLTSQQQTSSAGIGLALVKRIVERNGGRVWVTSVVGEGSTFRFTFPKRE